VRCLDGHDDLDPVVEVPFHQIGATEQVRLVASSASKQ
jgi:hypothetical protein